MDAESYAIRFGYGLPATGQQPLGTADIAARDWPGVTLSGIAPVIAAYRDARKAKDPVLTKALQRQLDALALAGTKAVFARAVGAADPFRERLVAFWADHFTVAPRNRTERALPGILQDEAIRPHVSGRFADMLAAVITHPAMLIYLDQNASFGPGSLTGKRRKKGLNENLARELLELHTLGVGAGYAQSDVTELAKLLTGLSVGPQGFVFDGRRAEPGAETVLGTRYDGKGATPILRALDDLAAGPKPRVTSRESWRCISWRMNRTKSWLPRWNARSLKRAATLGRLLRRWWRIQTQGRAQRRGNRLISSWRPCGRWA